MNYKKIYENLIESAINNPKSDLYKESHHIIPVCMGGNDEENNKVLLTAKQHFIAHWLLYKIYKTPKLAYAWHSMSRISHGQIARTINSRFFNLSKKARIQQLSINSIGSNNNFYGKTHTAETRKIISDKIRNKYVEGKLKRKTGKDLEKWVHDVAKQPASEKLKKINAERNRTHLLLQNKKTLETVLINRKDIHNYDSDVWVNPRKITPEKKHKCQYCGTITNMGNIVRWHGDNCKRK